MLKSIVKYCLIALLPISVGSNASAIAKNYTLSINVDSYPKRCGNTENKQFVIYLSLGNVELQDSLFGFDSYLSYDTNMVKFISYSKVNTFFGTPSGNDYAGANFNFEPGIISLWATSFDFFNPKVGNKALIAVLGEMKTNCFDSTAIKLNYIDFTDEFKGVVTDTVNATLYIKKESNENYVSSEFTTDSVDVTGITDYSSDIAISQSYDEVIKNMLYNFSYNSDDINISSVSSLNEGIIRIDSTVLNDEGLHVYTTSLGKFSADPLLRINYTRTNVSQNGNSTIEVLPVKSDNCSCTEIMKGSDLVLFWKHDTTTSVNADIIYTIKTTQLKNQVLVSSREHIKSIELFDFSGKIVYQSNYLPDMLSSVINTETLTSGAYFLRVVSDSEVRNKIILLNN